MNVSGKRKGSAAGNDGVTKRGKQNRVEWFNPKPDNSDREWLDGEENNYASHVIDLVGSLQDHERLSIKLELSSGRWLAILFVDPLVSDDPVYAISVRGKTAFDACVLLSYFRLVKFKGGWLQAADTNDGRFG